MTAAEITSDIGRVLEREAWVFRRMWRGTVFSSFVAPLLFLTALGMGLGGLVDERAGTVEGVRYLVFLTPGMLAGQAMQIGGQSSLWPVMMGHTWMRYFHGIVATPVSARGLYGGFISWIGVRTAISSAVFLVVAALFGGVPSWWAVLAVPAAVLTALSFAAPFAAYAGGVETDLAFPLIVRLFVMPLYLFSETFFPLEQLPPWLRSAAWISPLWHGVQLCRAATTGVVPSWGRLVVHVAVLVAVIAVAAVWGGRRFTAKLTA